MVRLTVTPAIAEALKALEADPSDAATAAEVEVDSEPSLKDAQVGSPISHGQVIDLWQRSNASGHGEYTLERLLKGSQVYIPPPPPKQEPSDEFKALMARLRREEEERKYHGMMKQPTRMEAFSQQYPAALSPVHAYAEVNRPIHKSDEGDDDVTYADVHRQMMLLLNFLVSIAGVAATIWFSARWWSTTSRLFLTMGGAIVVAIAEVVVYNGYIWRLGEAKIKQEKVKETQEVINSWAVTAESVEKTEAPGQEKVILLNTKSAKPDGVRKRQTAAPT